MQGKAIKSVSIKRLHQYLDVDLEFNPGLNVIYGKNGKGKTTVLHVLSNIMAFDFERFVYLNFASVEVRTFEGNALSVYKLGERVYVLLNGEDIGEYPGNTLFPVLSATGERRVADIFGGLPVYLPAYRSILEKVKGSSDFSKSNEYNLISRRESERLTKGRVNQFPWELEERANGVARKTLQCREWFGDFIPVIRYPSLSDVAEILTSEFARAQGEASVSDSTMMSSVFIGVFSSLISSHETPSDGEIEPLIAEIKNLLSYDQAGSVGSDDIGRRLSEEVAKAKITSTAKENAALKRVLKLYSDTLHIRSYEKFNAFKRIRDFESAVNLFLDGKAVRVSDRSSDGRSNRWGAYAYVHTDNNQDFPLTTLSSGERQIISMLFSATKMASSETGVFLIDEPELSLHVDWQRIILSVLRAQAPERQIIACTHSPEVGADHYDAVQMFAPELSANPVFDGREAL